MRNIESVINFLCYTIVTAILFLLASVLAYILQVRRRNLCNHSHVGLDLERIYCNRTKNHTGLHSNGYSSWVN